VDLVVKCNKSADLHFFGKLFPRFLQRFWETEILWESLRFKASSWYILPCFLVLMFHETNRFLMVFDGFWS
jgi:hypothetical protein